MYDESSPIPPEVQDLLSRLPRPMRQRVVADYDGRYAPFLAMLAAWKGAVQTHYEFGQASALARLEEQFFPLATWRFPPQTLALPLRPPARTQEILFEARFGEPSGANHSWISSGSGWLQPTVLRGVRTERGPETFRVLLDGLQVNDIHAGSGGGAGAAPALMERGQLVFVAAPEDIVHALTQGQWWLKSGGDRVWPVVCERFEGFLEFEREMQAARMSQRQLDLWLPAFFPYSRKILCFRLATTGEIRQGAPPASDSDRPFFTAMGSAADSDGGVPLRLLGSLRGTGANRARQFFATDRGEEVFLWNPVPVVQTAVTDHQFFSPFPEVGQEYALRMNGVPDLSAVVAYADGVAIPASVARVPSSDPRAMEPDVEVRFARQSGDSRRRTRVKIYHSSLGHGRLLPGHADFPTLLEGAGLRFAIPFPVLGGAVVGRPEDRAQAARAAWYHSVLRPPLLTEGDLVEILDQRTLAAGSGVGNGSGNGGDGGLLRLRHAVREIVDGGEDAITDTGFHWRSYLWPTLLARADRFDLGLDDDPSRFSPAEQVVPLIQRLRLDFETTPLAEGMPAFLLDDAAGFQASIVSQYFVVSCFRIEGRVIPGAGPADR